MPLRQHQPLPPQQQHMNMSIHDNDNGNGGRMSMTSGGDHHRPSQSQRNHQSPSNGNGNDSQGQATQNGCSSSSYNNSNGNIHIVGRATWFDPNDAASYLPQEEQTHLLHPPPRRRRHHQPPQYKHNVGPGHSNSSSSTSQQLPPASSTASTSTPLTTPECSYEWDPTNLTRFLSIRNQMACSLFATDDSYSCRHHLYRQKLSNHRRQEDIQSNDNTVVLTNNNTDAGGEGGTSNNIHYDNTTVDDCGGIWCSHPNFFSSSSSSSSSAATVTVVRPNTANTNATSTATTNYNTHHTNGTGNTNGNDDDNDHNSTVSAMVLLWNKLLPMPKDYFSYAIRYLFMETPLPLVGTYSCDRHHRSSSTTTSSSSSSSTSLSKNNMTLLHPQRCLLSSSNISSDGESIYLLPRYYLLRWMQWARYSIIHSSVKCWFDAWEKHDANHLHHDHKRHQRRKSKEVVVPDKETLERRRRTTTNNDGMMLLSSHDRNPQKQQQQRRRIYSLPSETIKALAALSLVSEQYVLFTNTEQDFVDWMTNVEGCWNAWNHLVMKYHTMLDQTHRRQQQHQHDDSMVEEEHGHHCKEGEWDEINRKNTNHNGEGGDFTQRLQYHSTLTNRQQQQESLHQSSLPSPPDAPITTSSSSPPIQIIPRPYPHLTFPVIESPGPIDSRMLSTRRNPLVMHRHVAISMKGILSSYNNSNTTCVTTIAPELSGNTNANVDEEINISVLSPAEEASESKLISFIDNSLWIPQQQHDDDQAILAQSTQKLAIVPVPISFYELLRSVHGVYSNDGDVSYAPPPMSNDKNVGKTTKNTSNITSAHPSSSSSSLLSTSSLLFHDQWKIGNDGANDDAQSVKRDRDDFHLDDNIGNNEHDSYYQGYHPLYFSNDPSHHHHHHHASAASTNGKPWPKHPLSCRPIEFRRQILPVSFQSEIGDDHEVEKENSKSISNAATQSQYSRAMQEATKSKKTNHAAAMTTTTTTANSKEKIDISAIAGYAVDAFPVEFIYTIVECDAAPTSTVYAATNSGRDKPSTKNVTFKLDTDRQGINSHQGIALACRRSSIFAVLRDLQQVAAPNRAQTCVRLWKKSACEGATTKGDGYDLLDVDTLCAAPTLRLPPSPRGGGDAAAKFSNPSRLMQDSRHPSQLTVEQWLGLEPLSVKRINEQKDLFYSSGSEKPVRVELLVEIRQTIASKWVRDPLELTNRLQIGDYVDAQDSTKKWYEAIVRDIKPNSVRVHYFGWGSKWDAELPRRSGSGSKLSPPVPLWTRTAKWREQIKVGDEVEIRESTSLIQRPKWHRATVLLVGGESDTPRDLEGGAELESFDVNSRKAPLTLLNLKRQVLVEVPQEMHNLPSATPLVPTTHGIPTAQPPFRRWVNLYGEEICNFNTHKTVDKKQIDLPATLKYTLESERAPVEVMRSFNNSHGSGFVRESLRGIPPAIGTVGLHNLGNTCYMNSILQCINHIKPITQYFLKGDYVKEINKLNPLGSGGRMATAYASFLSDVYSGEFSILAPRLLKHTLSCYAPQFRNNHQHDSQEFCQYLLDGLHEDLNRVKSKPYVEQLEALGLDDREAAMISWKKHLLRHDSIFVDYTQGLHRSHLTCPRCGRESIKFDVYSSISLPLVPAKNRSSIPLSDCLDQFAAGEQLDEHNAWYCPSCKRHVCALKLITLWTTPDILVLHLKRFTFEKSSTDGRILRSKIEDKVNFPIDRLDLSSYVLGPTDPAAPPVYKLFGVSEHTGSTANSGHYTATVLNAEDGKWYRYNDSHVGTTSGDAAVTGGAYLLFYRRANGALRWGGMEAQMMQQPTDAG